MVMNDHMSTLTKGNRVSTPTRVTRPYLGRPDRRARPHPGCAQADPGRPPACRSWERDGARGRCSRFSATRRPRVLVIDPVFGGAVHLDWVERLAQPGAHDPGRGAHLEPLSHARGRRDRRRGPRLPAEELPARSDRQRGSRLRRGRVGDRSRAARGPRRQRRRERLPGRRTGPRPRRSAPSSPNASSKSSAASRPGRATARSAWSSPSARTRSRTTSPASSRS